MAVLFGGGQKKINKITKGIIERPDNEL